MTGNDPAVLTSASLEHCSGPFVRLTAQPALMPQAELCLRLRGQGKCDVKGKTERGLGTYWT